MAMLAILAILSEGCSTAAAIVRRDGATVIAHIDRSDAQRLYVTADGDHPSIIERADVVDIDHPGKVGRTIGGISSAVGVGFVLLGIFAPSDCNPDVHDCFGQDKAEYLGVGLLSLLVGIPVLIRNMGVLYESRKAATAPSPVDFAPAPSRRL
jgi:hypothetical protein